MIRFLRLVITLICFTHCLNAFASEFGLSYSQLIIPKDPDQLRGIRTAVTYQPDALMWEHVQVYFDASYGYWWVNNNHPEHSLNSVAVAPYLRYWLAKKPIFSPFVEISVGPAYISKTRLGGTNLGMHFIFQDQASIGGAWGKERKFYSMISVYHYSNGSLCANNSGITAPLILTLGYRF
jgi:hypothetical protein